MLKRSSNNKKQLSLDKKSYFRTTSMTTQSHQFRGLSKKRTECVLPGIFVHPKWRLKWFDFEGQDELFNFGLEFKKIFKEEVKITKLAHKKYLLEFLEICSEAIAQEKCDLLNQLKINAAMITGNDGAYPIANILLYGSLEEITKKLPVQEEDQAEVEVVNVTAFQK